MGHTTSVPSITIRYPFHPLAGQVFRPLLFDEGPPAVYRLELTHRRVSVPRWMTEPGAAEVQVTDAPHVSVEHLLCLAKAVRGAIVAMGGVSGSLSSKSVAGEDCDHAQAQAVASSNEAARRSDSSEGRGGSDSRPVDSGSATSSPRSREKGERR